MQKVFFVLLIFILGTGLAGCGHKAPPKPPEDPPKEARV